MPDENSRDTTNITFDDVALAGDTADRERLIAELVSRMSLKEKIAQMSGSTTLFGLAVMLVAYGSTTYDSGNNKRLGIPPIKFTDGPRGVCLGRSTCFPVAMARAATWDAPLQERVGSVMGIEARSQGANFFGGVCINVPRHPGWGRAQETFGEDPVLLASMSVATIKGAQRHLMACAKHFA
jgi:beta-glucosidase